MSKLQSGVVEYHSGKLVREYQSADTAYATMAAYVARGFELTGQRGNTAILTSGAATVEVRQLGRG